MEVQVSWGLGVFLHYYAMVVHFMIKVQTGSHLYRCQCNIVVRDSVAPVGREILVEH